MSEAEMECIRELQRIVEAHGKRIAELESEHEKHWTGEVTHRRLPSKLKNLTLRG